MGVLNCWRNLCEDEVNTLRFVSLGFQSLVAFNSRGILSVLQENLNTSYLVVFEPLRCESSRLIYYTFERGLDLARPCLARDFAL